MGVEALLSGSSAPIAGRAVLSISPHRLHEFRCLLSCDVHQRILGAARIWVGISRETMVVDQVQVSSH